MAIDINDYVAMSMAVKANFSSSTLMERKSIIPDAEAHWLELRRQDITSSDTAALFGLSPYMTYAKLWHEKHGDIEPDSLTGERQKWGLALERQIAETILEGSVEDKSEYIRIEGLRVGSSFDFQLNDELVEVKNVDSFIYKRDWVEGEAPPHIELQVQHQMLVSGFDTCHICALVGGNKGVHIVRKANQDIQNKILQKCEEFWLSIDRNLAPQTDDVRDVSLVELIQSGKRKRKTIIPNDDVINLARAYSQISADIKELQGAQRKLRARIFKHAEDAEKFVGDAVEITLKPFRVKWRDG